MHYVFGDFSRPVTRNDVNVYYWKPPHTHNVGDLLSEVIVKSVHEFLGLPRANQTRRMLAIGSVIDSTQCDIVVWGSGLHDARARVPGVRLDVRAVRGPETRRVLLANNVHCPPVFGDPAVLLPLFYRPEKTALQAHTVIPHFSKEAAYLTGDPANTISTLTPNWRWFVSRVANSKLVISGSLHGIILAEAYGVPAIALTDIDTDWFKYEDYYLSTGRRTFPRVDSVEEALRTTPADLPDLKRMQDALLESFPKDLWSPGT
jgi:pyruvyltransferase